MLTGIACSAQLLTANELIGVWKVDKLSAGDALEQMPEDIKTKTRLIMETMVTSTFIFNVDRSAVINLKMEGFTLPKSYWMYDSTTGFVTVIPWEERKLAKPSPLVGIAVRRLEKTNEIVFFLEESPFQFYVVKDKDRTPPARIPVNK